VDRPDVVTAYYALLFVASDALNSFKEGRIAEDRFTADDLLEPIQVLDAEEVYIFSVVSSAPKGSCERRMLMVALIKHLRRLTVDGRLNTAYATGGTSQGLAVFEKAVARGIGRKLQDAAERADKHSLYRFDLNPSAFTQLTHMWGGEPWT